MNSSPEEALFALALAKPVEKRAAFLDVMCEGDAALRQRLEALLAAHEQPETLMATQAVRRDELHESQTSPSSSQGLTELSTPREAPDEAVGQTLGRYKLLEQIGEGGCGVVYVAEQKEPQRPSTQLTQALVAAEVTRRTSGWAEESASSCRKIRRERCLKSVGRSNLQHLNHENNSHQHSSFHYPPGRCRPLCQRR